MKNALKMNGWIVVLSMALLMGCGGGEGGSTSGLCSPSCLLGTVCMNGTCQVTDCSNGQQCPTGSMCVDDPAGSGAKVCTDLQCTNTTPCPNGQVCELGICKGGATGLGGQCGSCSTESDCNNGLVCTQVGASLHCTQPCSNDGNCSSGWDCGQASGASTMTCLPEVSHCSGCLVDGCAQGQICNPSNGMCTTPVATCGNCVDDGQCGAGSRCHGKTGTKFCVPECGAGCPNNSTCKVVTGDIMLCEWNNEGPCCLGDNCTGAGDPCSTVECAGALPICLNGVCVQCAQDADCPEGQACNDALTCEAGQCSGSTPWFNGALNKCCECLNGTHCGGKTCLTTTCMCEGNNPTGNICDTCADPYPGCAEFQGQWVCVQCSDNSHCSTNQCDLATYTCQGGGPAPAQGNCGSQGCAPGLNCDTNSGLCYDPMGQCDNVTSFCPNGGECLDLLSMLTGGSGGIPGGLPIPAGGGLPGNCTCTSGAANACPPGLTCGQGMWGIVLKLMDPTMNVPDTCQEGGGLPF